MSDIVERLRNWRTVHLARLHLLMEEAADEMERLWLELSDAGKSNHPEKPDSSTLTAAEREAVAWAAAIEPEPSGRWTQTQEAAWNQRAATLRALLERL